MPSLAILTEPTVEEARIRMGFEKKRFCQCFIEFENLLGSLLYLMAIITLIFVAFTYGIKSAADEAF
jgi:hypothetical protein